MLTAVIFLPEKLVYHFNRKLLFSPHKIKEHEFTFRGYCSQLQGKDNYR